jgi:NitT/TauT family transport system permease protein
MADWFEIRKPVSMIAAIVLGVIPILVLFGIWTFVTTGTAEERVISPLILPSPKEVVMSFHSLWFQAELSRSIVASAKRVIGGFLVAVVISLPLGVLAGSFPVVRASINPMVVFGAYLPIPSLVPLTMSFFGIGETQKIMFLAIAFVVFLLPMIIQSIDTVDTVYIQTAETLGASRFQIVTRVLCGVSGYDIYTAMRTCFGIGWSYIILAEIVAADRGLGNIIIIAQRRGPREHIWLVIVVIVALAFLTDLGWERLGRKLFPHKAGSR